MNFFKKMFAEQKNDPLTGSIEENEKKDSQPDGSWRKDSTFQRVLKNSGHLLSSNVISAALGFGQGILAVRMIGITDWGLVTTIITFASNINRLLTFRMSEVVVKRLGENIPKSGQEWGSENIIETSASIKSAMILETVTSITAFLVLVLLTPWAALNLGKNPVYSSLFLFYGVILLTNFITESSTGTLQGLSRFKLIARINIIQSVITAVIILAAFIFNTGVFGVILAYVIGKSINGLGLGLFALIELKNTLGKNWWKTELRFVKDPGKMFSFVLNTNLNGTINLFTRDNIPLYLAALLNTTQVGYFKLAQSLINLILLPLDPLIWPTYTEISRSVANKQWIATRQLLKRVSLLSASAVGIIGVFLVCTGWFILPLLYGYEAKPAYPVLLILLLGYGFASIFQWNRPLLLALGKPGYPVKVSFVVGIIELGLIFLIVPGNGYLSLAWILTMYFIISVGIMVLHGISEINYRSNNLL